MFVVSRVLAQVVVKCGKCGKQTHIVGVPFFCACGGVMYVVKKIHTDRDDKRFFDGFEKRW